MSKKQLESAINNGNYIYRPVDIQIPGALKGKD